nr:MAG TPA: hypothetical protein [Caudoviricetes sp.]
MSPTRNYCMKFSRFILLVLIVPNCCHFVNYPFSLSCLSSPPVELNQECSGLCPSQDTYIGCCRCGNL